MASGMASGLSTYMGPIIAIVIVVMVIMMIVKMITSIGGKKKKLVDAPKDPMERLITNYKEALKLNKSGAFHLKASGDQYKRGYWIGYGVYGVIPNNHEYIFFVRAKRWFTKEKPTMFVVEPNLVKDLNTRELLIECRGVDKIDRIAYPIPVYDMPKKEQDKLWERRARYNEMRMKQLLEMDLNFDLNISPKSAIRNSIIAASREEALYDDIEKVSEEERRTRAKEESMRQDEEKHRQANANAMRSQQSQPSAFGGLFGGGHR